MFFYRLSTIAQNKHWIFTNFEKSKFNDTDYNGAISKLPKPEKSEVSDAPIAESLKATLDSILLQHSIAENLGSTCTHSDHSK